MSSFNNLLPGSKKSIPYVVETSELPGFMLLTVLTEFF